MRRSVRFGLALGLLLCASEAQAQAPLVCKLQIEPGSLALEVGESKKLTLKATTRAAETDPCEGEAQEVGSAQWETRADAYTVDSTGLVQAVNEGGGLVTARYGGQVAAAMVEVKRSAEPSTEERPKPSSSTASAEGPPNASPEASGAARWYSAPAAANARCEPAFEKALRAAGEYTEQEIQRFLNDKRVGACGKLASVLMNTQYAVKVLQSTHEPGLEEVKPAMPEAVGAQGSPGEVAAVPSVAPTPLAGGTVALAGTETGPRMITSLGLNPGALSSETARTYAVQSRFADIAVVLPTRLENDDSGDAFDFVGVRARLNVVAPWSGETAYEQAKAIATERYRNLGALQAEQLSQLTNALVGAKDVQRCYDAILGSNTDDVGKFCGSPLQETNLLEAEKAARLALQRVRRAADKSYLGLDLRLNVGDYTFSGQDEAEHAVGTVGSLGAAYRLLSSEHLHLVLRGRAGGAYAHIGDEDDFGFDWGGAVEFGGSAASGTLRLSAGLEGRVGKDDASELADMNYTDLKLGLIVPASEGTNVGVSASVPVSGDHGFILTTAGDLAAFLPQ